MSSVQRIELKPWPGHTRATSSLGLLTLAGASLTRKGAQSLRDGLVAVAGGVLVDHRRARAGVTEPGHQLLESGAGRITQRITADLRKQIEEGHLGPGALLPSETEVARDYGVSRQTARSALQAPEHEGLVIVRPRRGRIVRSSQRLRWHLTEFERPDRTVLTTSDAWETDIESQGHDPGEGDLDVQPIQPPEAVAVRLNLDPRTDTCIVRRHIRYIDGKPAIISDDYFDERSSEAPS